MNYYKLTDSVSKKDVGKYPQVIDSIWNLQKDELKTNFTDIAKKGKVIGNFPRYDLILHSKAKFTDSIKCNSLTLTVSEIFYRFLLQYFNVSHQTWCIRVYNNEIKTNFQHIGYTVKNIEKLKMYEYLMFHISYPDNNFINFDKTIFYKFKKTTELVDFDKADFLSKKSIQFYQDNFKNVKDIPQVSKIEILDEVKFKNMEEYSKIIRNSIKIEGGLRYKPKIIYFNSKINKDIFRMTGPLLSIPGYYVSEKLKNEIEKQGFTGLDFIPLNELNTAYDINF